MFFPSSLHDVGWMQKYFLPLQSLRMVPRATRTLLAALTGVAVPVGSDDGEDGEEGTEKHPPSALCGTEGAGTFPAFPLGLGTRGQKRCWCSFWGDAGNERSALGHSEMLLPPWELGSLMASDLALPTCRGWLGNHSFKNLNLFYCLGENT